MRFGVLMCAGTIGLASAGVFAADNLGAPPGNAERGQKVFIHQMCHNCHGTVGQGGGVAGPRIAPNPFPWTAFVQQVRKPRQAMTPYTEQNLPEQDLADIYAYVVSIKPGPAAGEILLLKEF